MSDNPTPENVETENTVITSQEETVPENPFEQFVYYQRKGFEESVRAFEELLPPEFRKHSSAARENFKRSFQVIAEAITGEVQKVRDRGGDTGANGNDDEDRPATTGKAKVKIQVD